MSSILLSTFRVQSRLHNGIRFSNGVRTLDVCILAGSVQIKAAVGDIPRGNYSPAIQAREWPAMDCLVEEEEGNLRFKSPIHSGLHLQLNAQDGSFSLFQHGERIVGPVSWNIEDGKPRVAIELQPEQLIKGFAARHKPLNDEEGVQFRLWNTNECAPNETHGHATYTNLRTGQLVTPGRCSVGVLFNNMAQGWLRIRYGDEPNHLVHVADEGEIDFVIFPGPTPQEVMRNHHEVCGYTAMPSPLLLQMMQWRYGWTSANQPAELVDRLLKAGFQAGLLGLDLDAFPAPLQQSEEFFSGQFRSAREFSEYLLNRHIKLGMLIDPGIPINSDLVHQLGVDAFCRRPDSGELAVFNAFSGPCYLPDFFRSEVRERYARLLGCFMQEQGIRKVKIDKAEVGCAPPGQTDSSVWRDSHTLEPDAVEHRLDSGLVLNHNVGHDQYAYFMAEAVVNASLLAMPEKRPVVMVRSGCDGMHRLPGLFRWLGDGWSDSKYARNAHGQMLRFVNSGVFLVCQDTGHFFDEASPLYFRDCFRAGCWEPVLKPHTFKANPVQAPTEYGPDIERDLRRELWRREELAPYWYSLFWRAHCYAEPPFRPIWFDAWQDAAAYRVWDQWKVGPFILVAPLYGDEQPAASRKVHFPACSKRWFCLHTGKQFVGGEQAMVADYHWEMPIFIAEGAILPKQGILSKNRRYIDLWPFVSGDGKTCFTWYEDNGELHPKSATMYIEHRQQGTVREVTFGPREGDWSPPPNSTLSVRFRHCGRMLLQALPSIWLDGTPLDFESQRVDFDSNQDGTLVIRLDDDGACHHLKVCWENEI